MMYVVKTKNISYGEAILSLITRVIDIKVLLKAMKAPVLANDSIDHMPYSYPNESLALRSRIA
jgi:hypothetical protein